MQRRALGILLVLAACGASGGTTGPASSSTRAYLRALKNDDAHAAYDLLAPAVRHQVSYREFAAMWKASSAERSWQAAAITESLGTSTGVGEHVLVRFDDGQTIALEHEDDAWRLDTAVFYRAHSPHPRDVITALADALERRDLDGVVATLVRERRDAVGEQLRGFLRGMKEHRADPIDEYGTDQAELRWDDGGLRYRIVLHREDGDWKVADISIRPVPPEGGGGGDSD